MTASLDKRRHLELEGTRNIRDLGGYQTVDGRTTRWKTMLRADNLDALVFRVLVEADALDEAMGNFLYRDRIQLSVYAKGSGAKGLRPSRFHQPAMALHTTLALAAFVLRWPCLSTSSRSHFSAGCLAM